MLCPLVDNKHKATMRSDLINCVISIRYTKTEMQMLEILSYEDYDSLPLTKWNIKQPEKADGRKEALASGTFPLTKPPLSFVYSLISFNQKVV